MKNYIFMALLLLGICYNNIGQTNNEDNFNLAGLFTEEDLTPPIDDERYFNIPERGFSHAQIMNIPETSQADLLHKVLIIVDSALYAQLDADINRYAYDIHYVYGSRVIMERIYSETHQDIKNLILSHQTHLDGCIFIGDIVPAWYKATDIVDHDSIRDWPCDLYYMDLTGVWTDTNQDGFFDQYSGDMKPEIFIGRISTSNMGALIGEIEECKHT